MVNTKHKQTYSRDQSYYTNINVIILKTHSKQQFMIVAQKLFSERNGLAIGRTLFRTNEFQNA